MKISAILVAGGTGSRFGGAVPKQVLLLAGKPVMRHAAEALLAHVDLLQPVGDAAIIGPALEGLDYRPIVPGGAERQDSVRNGLQALAPYAPDIVLVHDAARPIIPPGTIEALLAALQTYEGAIPAVPVTDTLKRGHEGAIVETVPRGGLFRAQTPQAFRFATLARLHGEAKGMVATDDAALLEAADLPVALVAGAEQNIKITYAEDFSRVQHILGGQLIPRIGSGFDVHAMESGRPMIICGVTIPFEKGLAGHSDADVGIHALCDAIYGALAEGDIGRHFPPSEATWKDMDSARFLRHAAERIAARGGVLCNADITIICEQPKITPHATAMRTRLSELLGVTVEQISVKATTSERLGFTGRGEGIAAQASVIVMIPA
ncbi:MAG: bifunctional 2-C-methyl-D-erythritol 4-phosphate cytidylyltransferase/2-C-methyl-D-erythritol 2,4-cyclodiphosphate synthase [Acidocella sp. 20-57-95]|nr:MAG: bifunctional 2-C-methyl-D-erythritol 4-phosphate cytidylyltransferase/2-C-methyl-D-erythritol 2,4-cyclodiphosphate synthase [Acidocella sp. 20-57-95]OYV62550.1 MAG: bifunctional 2-C-methyl-D-erythritol 4-phosphate cytidylyltransferase/2-C-methyl-D-erythritol 2,4-cyclodiphosphate synthase [Acidocella sp. 21-58-7]HQT64139.1 2-C-methyl-D-erythritol 2,4-cyclodiphosphate synthase [Acidocella sp.]HQU03088.1 2-C-methyl-D-erythritol 2,4-cyclodiphosphate synthase [Acidocella sp.]